MKQDKHMDQWMRDQLDDHGSILPEGGWEGLQDLQKKNKRRPAFFWWLTGFGAAAALFLTVWLMWTPASEFAVPMADKESISVEREIGKSKVPNQDKEQQAIAEAPQPAAIDEPEKLPEEASQPSKKPELPKELNSQPLKQQEVNRKAAKLAPTLKPLALLPLHPEYKSKSALTLQALDAEPPSRDRVHMRWTGYTSYGTGSIRTRNQLGLAKASASGTQYEALIKNSTFRLHRLGLGIEAGWKKGSWAWSAGMLMERSWVASQITGIDAEGIGNAQNPDSNAVASNQDISREFQANPARFWTLGAPIGVRYYPWNRKVFLAAGINPELNFGAAGTWVLDKSSQGINHFESAETSLGIPRFNLGASLGLGWDITPTIGVQYQVRSWAAHLLNVEPFGYSSTVHQLQIRITIPG